MKKIKIAAILMICLGLIMLMAVSVTAEYKFVEKIEPSNRIIAYDDEGDDRKISITIDDIKYKENDNDPLISIDPTGYLLSVHLSKTGAVSPGDVGIISTQDGGYSPGTKLEFNELFDKEDLEYEIIFKVVLTKSMDLSGFKEEAEYHVVVEGKPTEEGIKECDSNDNLPEPEGYYCDNGKLKPKQCTGTTGESQLCNGQGGPATPYNPLRDGCTKPNFNIWDTNDERNMCCCGEPGNFNAISTAQDVCESKGGKLFCSNRNLKPKRWKTQLARTSPKSYCEKGSFSLENFDSIFECCDSCVKAGPEKTFNEDFNEVCEQGQKTHELYGSTTQKACEGRVYDLDMDLAWCAYTYPVNGEYIRMGLVQVCDLNANKRCPANKHMGIYGPDQAKVCCTRGDLPIICDSFAGSRCTFDKGMAEFNTLEPLTTDCDCEGRGTLQDLCEAGSFCFMNRGNAVHCMTPAEISVAGHFEGSFISVPPSTTIIAVKHSSGMSDVCPDVPGTVDTVNRNYKITGLNMRCEYLLKVFSDIGSQKGVQIAEAGPIRPYM